MENLATCQSFFFSLTESSDKLSPLGLLIGSMGQICSSIVKLVLEESTLLQSIDICLLFFLKFCILMVQVMELHLLFSYLHEIKCLYSPSIWQVFHKANRVGYISRLDLKALKYSTT